MSFWQSDNSPFKGVNTMKISMKLLMSWLKRCVEPTYSNPLQTATSPAASSPSTLKISSLASVKPSSPGQLDEPVEIKLANLNLYDKDGVPEIIRVVARKLNSAEYYTVGRVLRELSDSQVEELFDMTLKASNGIDGKPLKILVCLAEIMAQAEGVNIDQPDVTRTTNFMVMVSLEKQARDGTLVFYRERATLGPEVNLDKLYAM